MPSQFLWKKWKDFRCVSEPVHYDKMKGIGNLMVATPYRILAEKANKHRSRGGGGGGGER